MMSVMHPRRHAEAFERFLATDASSSRNQEAWSEEHGPMPSLYLSHGAPPVFDDTHWMGQLFGWSQSMPKPKAVLIVSAHWESAPLSLSSSDPGTPLVYDFYGFAPIYYRMTYPTPDAGHLSRRVAAMMPEGEPVHQHVSRGLDHGAWVPLLLMYPQADLPVVQLSVQPGLDPAWHVALGERLRPLRDDGVLVLASGGATHNLRDFGRYPLDSAPQAYALAFADWLADGVERGDVEALSDPWQRAPEAQRNHPTPEHLLPFHVALGSANDPAGRRLHAGWTFGVLSMSAFAWD